MGVREERDVSAAEIAKEVGVTSTSYSEWEGDKKKPRDETLEKVAAYLGVTPAFLRYGVRPAMNDLLAGARQLTEEELDRADVIAARATVSKKKPAAKKRRRAGEK